MSDPILRLTDGSTRINLLTKEGDFGFFLEDWTPAVADYKGEGIWRDSSLADGRRLVDHRWSNVVETYELKGSGYDQDDMSQTMQDARRLLEKAASYWSSNWQDEPVWIEAKAKCETNTRYGLVYKGRIPEDGNPYAQPFFREESAVLNDLALMVERLPWWLGFAPVDPCDEDITESIYWTEEGCDPSYLIFDGADSLVNCGSDASLDDIPDNAVAGRGKITAEALIRANSLGEANAGVVFRKLSVFMRMDVAGLYAEVRCAAQNAISTSGADEFTPDSLWHHICMVYDETGADTPAARTIYLAVDGVWVVSYPTQQVSIGNYVTDAASDLIIGNNSGATTTFDGDIGWVRISDIIRYDPAGGNFTPDPRCTPPDPSTGTQLLLRHSPGYGATTLDYSGHDNDGTLTSALWDCDCDYENTVYPCWPNYLEFNGETSLVNCGSDVTLDDIPDNAVAGRGQITAEALIRADGYGEATLGYIVAKGWIFRINSTVGLQAFIACAAQTATSESGLDEFTADGLWHHVLMTYDETGGGTPAARTIYLAIDGVWVTSYPTQQVSIGNYTTDAASSLTIGNDPGATRTFDGDIGWVRVSDVIRYDPAGGNFTPEPRCALPTIDADVMLQVIYEGTGATTYDRSGNDNDGAITSAEWGCDCTYTDEDDVDCDCVEAGNEQIWPYDTWKAHTVQPVNQVYDIIEASCGYLLACELNIVWRSSDGGTVWVAAAASPPTTPLAMLEATDGYIYAASGAGVYRSGDCGDNWVLRNAAATTGDLNSIAGFRGNLYLVRSTGVERSADGGATWNIAFTVNSASAILATDDYIYVSALPSSNVFKMFRSSDGTTWDEVFTSTGLIYSIVELSDGYLYAGDNVGIIYRSRDGETWGEFGNLGVPTTINDIILGSDGFYYIAGSGGDIWKGYGGDNWKSVVSTGSTCTSLVEYSINNRIYAALTGSIYISPLTTTVGRSDTCLDEVYVANKDNLAQLTHMFVYDASITTYTAQFPATVFPYFLLPSPFAANDAAYFGIDRNVKDSGTFCSLVFDIAQALWVSGVPTFTWQYWNGAWVALNVEDGTASGGIPFSRENANSVHWVPPTDWTTTAVNGVTGWWVRLLVSAPGTWVQSPLQQHRDVYTVTWPHVDIDDAQVGGDIPALLYIKARNRSDEDHYDTKDELDLLSNRMLVSLRSLDRGLQYVAYINVAQDGVVANGYSQNPIGIVATDGTGTTTGANNRAPSGIACVHTTPPTGSLSTYADAATVTFGPSIARDFYGTYHVFLRAQLEEPAAAPAGDDGDVQVRLQVRSGSGGITFTTQHRRFVGWDANGEVYKDFQLLDFGRVNLPVSSLFRSTELPDEFTIVIQISSASGTNLEVNLYDLVLIPVDEWSGDFIDNALENDSGVGNGYRLDVDSLTYPKRRIRALVRSADSSEFIKAAYQPITPGPAILQANADQRLWFLSARAVYLGKDTAGAGTTLTDTYSDFIRAGVRPGMIAYDITGATSATITTVNQTTLVTDANIWALNDEYMIVCNGIYRSEPWVAHSVQLRHNPRYLSFRGDR